MAILVIWIICAIVGALIADKKGRSAPIWALICSLTGVFGILVLALVPRVTSNSPAPGELESPARVPCPACSEPILPTAKLCKHCGTALSPLGIAAPAAVTGAATAPDAA